MNAEPVPAISARQPADAVVDRDAAALVEVRDLTVRFVTREATVHAVNGVNFSVRPGEVLCILGESGCGKSVTLRSMMRLLPPRRTRIEGSICIDGQDVLAIDKSGLREMRGAWCR
jgi:peptide/nickel transport system ATP-binding protein